MCCCVAQCRRFADNHRHRRQRTPVEATLSTPSNSNPNHLIIITARPCDYFLRCCFVLLLVQLLAEAKTVSFVRALSIKCVRVCELMRCTTRLTGCAENKTQKRSARVIYSMRRIGLCLSPATTSDTHTRKTVSAHVSANIPEQQQRQPSSPAGRFFKSRTNIDKSA